MADVRDEFGNPIQLTDERGNPVQLTDEFGNPMHLTGVAVHGGGAEALAAETRVETTVVGPPAAVYDPKHSVPSAGAEGAVFGAEGERVHERSNSSSSSSSEDDGKGGRRKKKGLKEKIKEKLSVGKHKDKEEHAPYPTTVTSETRPGEHQIQHEHEKKSMIEKIKEKLPGHH